MRNVLAGIVFVALLFHAIPSRELCAAADQDDAQISNALQKELQNATLRGVEADPGQIAPFGVSAVVLGAPRKITRFGGEDYFFRVPIIHKQSGRQISYTDLKEKDGELKIVLRSVSRIRGNYTIENLPLDVLELKRDQIVSKAETRAGKDAKPLSDPTLVYDRSEHVVGWAVKMSVGGSKETTVFVTARLAYEPAVRVATGFRGGN